MFGFNLVCCCALLCIFVSSAQRWRCGRLLEPSYFLPFSSSRVRQWQCSQHGTGSFGFLSQSELHHRIPVVTADQEDISDVMARNVMSSQFNIDPPPHTRHYCVEYYKTTVTCTTQIINLLCWPIYWLTDSTMQSSWCLLFAYIALSLFTQH